MRVSKTEIKVRGFHLDLYGHVNNARYLEFLEEARWDHYESVMNDERFDTKRYAFIIVNININYRGFALLHQTVEVETFVKQTGKKSMVIKQIIRKKDDDAIITDAEVTIVLMDNQTGKPAVLEGDIKTLLES